MGETVCSGRSRPGGELEGRWPSARRCPRRRRRLTMPAARSASGLEVGLGNVITAIAPSDPMGG